MSLKNAIERLKYDSRMYEINMKSRILDAPDLKKHLDKLPDLKSNCLQVDLDSTSDHDDVLNGHGSN